MLTWSHGLVVETTQNKIRKDIHRFEGNFPFMYLDTVSTVTVGSGTALFTAADAQKIPFIVQGSSAAATSSEIAVAWNAVQACSSPRGKKCNLMADYFQSVSKLRIVDTEIKKLVDKKLQEFYLHLVRIYPGFDSIPESAKIALFDMIYNLGPHNIEYVFVHFTDSVRARKWLLAAQQSKRPQVNALRNATTKQHFLEAAKLAGQAGALGVTPHSAKVAVLKKSSVVASSFHRQHAQALPLPPPPEPFPLRPYQAPIPAVLRVVTKPVIVSGDRGENVRVVQNAVNRVMVARRPPLALDGDFGKMTLTAVRGAQAAAGLVADGVVGAETRRALGLVLA